MKKVKQHGKNIGTILLKATPILGSIKDNYDSKDGGKGKVHWSKIVYSVIRIVGLIFGSRYAPEIIDKL